MIDAKLKRSTKNPSVVFAQVLKQAEAQLLSKSEAATSFRHSVLRGDARADALAEFLAKHLPIHFALGKGEAVDCFGNSSGELDLFVYDSSSARAILETSGDMIVPAEALYAVIEVKSTLTQNEINTCAVAAMKVRALKPFKKQFQPTPVKGAKLVGEYRCPYIVFAYNTDLVQNTWAQKEFDRVVKAAAAAGGQPDIIERVIVLDRGMLRPQVSAALEASEGLFLEFYVHLINFLTRERKRRPPIDWTAYTSRRTWTKLL